MEANMHISYDNENKLFTVYSLTKGGPIVSDSSLEKAKQKYGDGLALAVAIRKFFMITNTN